MEESDEAYKLKGIKRIAIVGAGNAGITAAKFLLAEKAFEQIDILEQSSHIGGLWNYTPENTVEDSFSIPQTTATAPLDSPIWRNTNGINGSGGKPTSEAAFISPLYTRLEANLPIDIMRHSDLDFPPDAQLFPTHECILEYLEKYANDIRHLIQFETQVQNISRTTEAGTSKWLVTTRNLQTTTESTSEYDAVLLASGHFNVPYIPDIPGIHEWSKSYPNSVSHSKHFREPEALANKKVISIGRGYSGLDIAMQLSPHVKPPLHISTYNPSGSDPDGKYIHHPEIATFLPATDTHRRAVRFVDGHIETDIDHVLFCTGYLYSFPFLPDFTRPPNHETVTPTQASNGDATGKHKTAHLPPIITDGARPHNLYKYMLYNADATLAVLSMPQQIVPFPIVEAQSAVVARLWSGRLSVPSRREMVAWEEESVKSMGEGKKWLWLKAPRDGRYLNELADWAATAEGEGAGRGKTPARWGPRELWVRERVLDVKKAFVERGKERRFVRKLEDLGFDFERKEDGSG